MARGGPQRGPTGSGTTLPPTNADPTKGPGRQSRLNATLGPEEIGELLVSRGFGYDVNLSPDDNVKAGAIDRIAKGIAVVMCESTGRWSATSRNPDGGTNRGGWQIDDKAHPQYPPSCLHDPECSTDAAKALTNNGRDYSIWACGNSNPARYKAAATTAWDKVARQSGGGVAQAIGGALGDPIAQIATVLEAIAKFFVGLGELLLTPEGWIRLGKLGGGTLLVAVGVNRLAKLTLDLDPLGTVGHAATGAVAGGLAAGPGGAAIGALASGALGGSVGRATSKIAGATNG